jgi:hypothetical protein
LATASAAAAGDAASHHRLDLSLAAELREHWMCTGAGFEDLMSRDGRYSLALEREEND